MNIHKSQLFWCDEPRGIFFQHLQTQPLDLISSWWKIPLISIYTTILYLNIYIYILVGGLEHFFPYIGNNHPNWLIFFRGVQTTNQYILLYIYIIYTHNYTHTPCGSKHLLRRYLTLQTIPQTHFLRRQLHPAGYILSFQTRNNAQKQPTFPAKPWVCSAHFESTVEVRVKYLLKKEDPRFPHRTRGLFFSCTRGILQVFGAIGILIWRLVLYRIIFPLLTFNQSLKLPLNHQLDLGTNHYMITWNHHEIAIESPLNHH